MGPAAFVPTALMTWAVASAPVATDSGSDVVVDPAEVRAAMFFDGAVVHVTASVPAGREVAIVCTGDPTHLTLRKKGKVLGAIWMNVADVSFGAVPTLYLVRTSVALAEVAPPEALIPLGVGYDALAASSHPGPGAEDLFGELVRLKERDGLWAVEEGGVTLRAASDAVVATTDMTLPARTPPGTYQVLVYAFGDAGGELVGIAELVVRQDGLAAFISELATNHGLLYGILAAVVAVAVGLLTGGIFGLGSRRGH